MYDIKIRGNDINGGKLMELLYKIKDRVQQESIDYIEENRSSVVKNNQKTLFALNIIYFVVVVGYLLASMTVFSEWQVTGVYASRSRTSCCTADHYHPLSEKDEIL
mgnify:CR=1 FL=1